jgi:hypothetical protein
MALQWMAVAHKASARGRRHSGARRQRALRHPLLVWADDHSSPAWLPCQLCDTAYQRCMQWVDRGLFLCGRPPEVLVVGVLCPPSPNHPRRHGPPPMPDPQRGFDGAPPRGYDGPPGPGSRGYDAPFGAQYGRGWAPPGYSEYGRPVGPPPPPPPRERRSQPAQREDQGYAAANGASSAFHGAQRSSWPAPASRRVIPMTACLSTPGPRSLRCFPAWPLRGRSRPVLRRLARALLSVFRCEAASGAPGQRLSAASPQGGLGKRARACQWAPRSRRV